MSKSILISLLVTVFLATASVAEAQQPKKVPTIGYLSLGTGTGTSVETFREGLKDLGYVEGKNIIIEYRRAEGKLERLSELAAELVRLKVDIIVAGQGGGPVILAAKNATTTIPIVAAIIAGDPVATGLIASFARPGGNITGFSNLAPELAWRRLELVKETFPKITRVAFLWNPSVSDPSLQGTSRIEETQAVAQALGIRILSLEVRSADELASALESAVRERAGALLVPAYMVGTHGRQITEFSLKKRLPVSCDTRQHVERGVCLMAYGSNLTENFRRTATYVDKILKGAKPANLPVEAPRKFELVINLKTAKQIGVTIPPVVLYQADEVIK